MKPLRTLLVTCSILALAAGAFAKDFEGKVAMKKTTGGKTTDITYFLKGGILRVETAPGTGPASVILVDLAKRQALMLMDQQKRYMTFNLPSDQDATQNATTQVVQTGETEKILGHVCEKLLVKGKDFSVESWGTKELGHFVSLPARGPMGGRNSGSAWEAALAADGYFPLRTVVKDKAGNETTRTEAVTVEAGSLDAALFAVPKDYQELVMPSLGGLNPFGRKDN